MASNNTSTVAFNDTLSSPEPSGWNITTSWEVVLGLAILFANLAMLTLLLTKKKLRSSFTTYLMLLFACNAVSALIYYPIEIIHQMTNQWLMGTFACTIKFYNNSVVAAVQTHIHLMITVNRIWAIVFPVSYKNHHTIKVAFLICFGTMVYVHAVNLPAVVIDAVYYRKDEVVSGCLFDYDAQTMLETVTMFITLDFPTVFICGSYPFLWYRRRKQMVKVGAPNSLTAKSGLPTNATPANGDGAAKPKAENKPTGLTNQQASAERNKRATRSFRILTLLTASIFVCCMPDLMYYTVANFTTVPYDMLYTVIDNLYTVQSLLDPVLFALSLDSVREAIAGLWGNILGRKRGPTQAHAN